MLEVQGSQMRLFMLWAAAVPIVAPPSTTTNAVDIVQRSVMVLERDWQAAPEYSFVENDIEVKDGTRSQRKSAVIMIDASPYWMLLEENGKPLTREREANERRKLAQQISVRRGQSTADRQRRIAQYDKERRQDNALIREMTEALDFKLAGEETLHGHSVYVLQASPKPGYEPKSLETRVLTGMRGTLWVDRKSYQWVKVEAEVFRPVAFGLFIAKVQTGTRFSLEQSPVSDSVWLPSRFTMTVNASIFWWHKASTEDESFFAYRPARESLELYAGSKLPPGR